MILHGGIRLGRLLRGSLPFLALVTLWNICVVTADELLLLPLVGDPTPPVTTLGVAVAFYLGFKNTSAFGRWWEARKIWGEIVNSSRDWAFAAMHLPDIEGRPDAAELRRTLIERHIAWLHALAGQLRTRTALTRSRPAWAFGIDRRPGMSVPEPAADTRRHPETDEAASLDAATNKAAYLLFCQAGTVRRLAATGALDSLRQVALMDRLQRLADAQGKCERIKNTPFPRQVADLGEIFTWIFIFLLPLLFNESFDLPAELDGKPGWPLLVHMLLVVPTSVLVCWVFYLTEKVSDSMEDPFDGSVTDVPVSAICRNIEIDLRQMTRIGDPPQPLPPVARVLY